MDFSPSFVVRLLNEVKRDKKKKKKKRKEKNCTLPYKNLSNFIIIMQPYCHLWSLILRPMPKVIFLFLLYEFYCNLFWHSLQSINLPIYITFFLHFYEIENEIIIILFYAHIHTESLHLIYQYNFICETIGKKNKSFLGTIF